MTELGYCLFAFSSLFRPPVAQKVMNSPAMQETPVPSLNQDDPLEKGMATHTSTFAWRMPWTEESGGLYSPWGCKESDTTERLTHLHTGPPTTTLAEITMVV